MTRFSEGSPEERLFLKRTPATTIGTRTRPRPRAGDGGFRIRCPRCAWEPRREDRWSCSCSHVWNTFETSGVCPACGHAWDQTQCLRCHEWSPHRLWYVWE